ncbi:MAG TPA: YbhB/YbcL family Raf kinase inhibitor-like protein [Patescibacteria group bacterium]|nr:YbhB/YbcL family Raf kinase inhibitor-like protein [Patescibacteria group bacterium]
MKIVSSAFTNNQVIPTVFSCHGDNINPPLMFEDVPQNAKSLALIVDDPDAPGGTFVHWVLYNILPTEKGIGQGVSFDNAKEGLNGTGKPGYTGPCPPSGTHHYHFKLYALDEMLEIEGVVDKVTLTKAMEGHIIAQSKLIGLFSK